MKRKRKDNRTIMVQKLAYHCIVHHNDTKHNNKKYIYNNKTNNGKELTFLRKHSSIATGVTLFMTYHICFTLFRFRCLSINDDMVISDSFFGWLWSIFIGQKCCVTSTCHFGECFWLTCLFLTPYGDMSISPSVWWHVYFSLRMVTCLRW